MQGLLTALEVFALVMLLPVPLTTAAPASATPAVSVPAP